jgi:surface antigen
MTEQDRLAADAAMAAALDSTPIGKPHPWSNAATGNRGAFAALAEGYRSGSVLCRRFSAEMTIEHAALPPMRGTACRVGAETWTIERIGPAKPV